MVGEPGRKSKLLFNILFVAAAQVSLFYLLKWLVSYHDERKTDKAKKNSILRRLNESGGRSLDKLVLSSYEQTILAEVVAPEDIHIEFKDIGGLDNIIEELRESVIYPLTAPHLFSVSSSLLSAPKGVLLYGPPGCGKTMLAKALARESGACFINLHISTLTEKWYGDSNKLVAAVFTLARKLQPTIVFIDEIDAVLRSRSSTDHEASTMVKAEFMTHWDGLLSAADPVTGAPSQIVILGATNRIADIDDAILRRLPKKFPIPLPDAASRRRILNLILKDTKTAPSPKFDIEELVAKSAGMSGSELADACKDAAMVPVREYIKTVVGKNGRIGTQAPVSKDHVRGVENTDFFRKHAGGRRPVEEEMAALAKVEREVEERVRVIEQRGKAGVKAIEVENEKDEMVEAVEEEVLGEMGDEEEAIEAA